MEIHHGHEENCPGANRDEYIASPGGGRRKLLELRRTPHEGSEALRPMKLVLDTNIVLDWLLFEDARLSELQRAWDERRVQLITHMPALEELRRVLTYPQFKLSQSAQRLVLESYESRVRVMPLPDGVTMEDLGMPAGFPRCKDCDDDHFLALAHHHRADAIVSKDRAVLDLAKRARKFGVIVLSPLQLTTKLSDTTS